MEERLQAAATWLWHNKRAGASTIDVLLNVKREEDCACIWREIDEKFAIQIPFETIVSEGLQIYESYLSKGIHLIFAHSEAYPTRLLTARSAIPILSVQGDVSLLQRRQIAIVGSRKTTEMGMNLGTLVVDALMSRGFIVTSGGALGIDAMAHREAMKLGQPTIVVTATDVTQCYPRENEDIFTYARTNGAVVSQFPIRTSPRRELFPSRNTLMAGLSDATCIIQCRENSGALYTAKASTSMQRPVFVIAMPGFSHANEGGLALVKMHKAKLVSSVHDFDDLGLGDQETKGVVAQLGLESLYGSSNQVEIQKTKVVKAPSKKNATQQTIVACPYEDAMKQAIYRILSSSCIGREDLARQLGSFDLCELNEALFEMECDGVIVNLAGGYRLETQV